MCTTPNGQDCTPVSEERLRRATEGLTCRCHIHHCYHWFTPDFLTIFKISNIFIVVIIIHIILKYFPVWPILVQSSVLIFNNNKNSKKKKNCSILSADLYPPKNYQTLNTWKQPFFPARRNLVQSTALVFYKRWEALPQRLHVTVFVG